jgi:hypothetical protein
LAADPIHHPQERRGSSNIRPDLGSGDWKKLLAGEGMAFPQFGKAGTH